MLPIDDDTEPHDGVNEDDAENTPVRQPLMLLALNATDAVDWEDLQEKVRAFPFIAFFSFTQYLCLDLRAP